MLSKEIRDTVRVNARADYGLSPELTLDLLDDIDELRNLLAKLCPRTNEYTHEKHLYEGDCVDESTPSHPGDPKCGACVTIIAARVVLKC